MNDDAAVRLGELMRGRDLWLAEWKALDFETRWRIRVACRVRGRPTKDIQETALAVGYCVRATLSPERIAAVLRLVAPGVARRIDGAIELA